jgi:hypothetical protein
VRCRDQPGALWLSIERAFWPIQSAAYRLLQLSAVRALCQRSEPDPG